MKIYPLTSEFGAVDAVRNGRIHNGIDIAMEIGTQLRSVINGTVTQVFVGSTSLGRGVEILGENGKRYVYAHMEDVEVTVGQRVSYGTLIGESGNTGNSTGAHLHFSVQDVKTGDYVDPTEYKPMLDRLSGSNYFSGGPANTRESMEFCAPSDDIPWYDVDGRMQAGIELRACETKQELLGFLHGLAGTVAELSYTFALIGGGILIVLRVAGMTRATKYFGVLQITHILIRSLIGGLR